MEERRELILLVLRQAHDLVQDELEGRRVALQSDAQQVERELLGFRFDLFEVRHVRVKAGSDDVKDLALRLLHHVLRRSLVRVDVLLLPRVNDARCLFGVALEEVASELVLRHVQELTQVAELLHVDRPGFVHLLQEVRAQVCGELVPRCLDSGRDSLSVNPASVHR